MMKNRALPCDVARIARFYFTSLGTPLANSLVEKLDRGDWDGIAAVAVNPRDYRDTSLYARDAAAAGFLKKFKELPAKADRRAAAVVKWWQGERDCYRTNERLTRYLPRFASSADLEPGVVAFIANVRKIILSWIGSHPPDSYQGKFGPGATYSDRSGFTTVPDKMSSNPVLTQGAIWFLPQWLGTSWGIFHASRLGKYTIVPGNRFATVPKTALTDRSIASEPSINMFYQLPLGGYLKNRMKRFAHWDMVRAPELHALIAQSSSRTKEFATLDLANASDTVAKVLVELLLPTAWYTTLDDLRSKKTYIDGKWVVLEKFSSMGNGFTFELETIIFAAIAVATTRECGWNGWLGRDVFVFGDDIIVKDDVARPLKSVLGFFGFTLNDEKSFWGDVPFRESCGGDFFNGVNVRPYFLKEKVNGPSQYIALANGLRACIERIAQTGYSPGLRAWFATLDFLPTQVRKCRGPVDLGDIVIHDVQERWTSRTRDCIREILAWAPRKHRFVSWNHFEPDIILACATLGVGDSRRGVMPRDAVLSHGVCWIPYS